jgi:Transposase
MELGFYCRNLPGTFSCRKELPVFYAGIDWSDTHHDALVIDDAGQQVNAPIRVAHSRQGLDKLHAFLESIAGAAGKENMGCIVETSHGLLIAFLLDQGWPVYPVHPTTVDCRRAASGAKIDSIYAYWASENRTRRLHRIASLDS